MPAVLLFLQNIICILCRPFNSLNLFKLWLFGYIYDCNVFILFFDFGKLPCRVWRRVTSRDRFVFATSARCDKSLIILAERGLQTWLSLLVLHFSWRSCRWLVCCNYTIFWQLLDWLALYRGCGFCFLCLAGVLCVVASNADHDRVHGRRSVTEPSPRFSCVRSATNTFT